MTVTWRLQANAATGPRRPSGRAVMRVPGPSGRREFRIRTGMARASAGWIVFGCSTFAPKYASSAASANDSCGTSCGAGYTRGSAVSMPSTSVQIWISSAARPAPMIDAE